MELLEIDTVETVGTTSVRDTTGELQIPAVWHGSPTGAVEANIYKVIINDGTPSLRTATGQEFVSSFFSTNDWSPQSATGTDETLNAATITLEGNASIQRAPNPGGNTNFGTAYIFGASTIRPATNEIALAGYFDHYLDDDLIASIMDEESIS